MRVPPVGLVPPKSPRWDLFHPSPPGGTWLDHFQIQKGKKWTKLKCFRSAGHGRVHLTCFRRCWVFGGECVAPDWLPAFSCADPPTKRLFPLRGKPFGTFFSAVIRFAFPYWRHSEKRVSIERLWFISV